jgi:small subunit ribosomal protein S16
MLVIRMQRTGRKGHAMFRVVVQDSRRTPTSGKVVVSLGSYDPHAKTVQINKDKARFYLEHGAQPSDRVARLLKAEGVELPNWVVMSSGKQGSVRNAEKRRSTTPAPEPEPEPEETIEVEVAEAAETTPPETGTGEDEPSTKTETEIPSPEPETATATDSTE